MAYIYSYAIASRRFATANGVPYRRCGELDLGWARKRKTAPRLRQTQRPYPGRESATQIGQLH